MSIQNLALFLVAAVVVCLTPGPDILTVITRSLTQGTRAGLVATLGFATGLIVHTTVAATGLAILLHESRVAFRLIQCAGAAYLVYLALRMALAHPAQAPMADEKDRTDPTAAQPPRHLRQIYAQSILMNVLNPKVTLFFLAFLSKFHDSHGALPFWLQMVVLGGLFAGCTVVTFGGCALAAGPLAATLRRRPQAGRPLRWATALMFLAIAVLLVLD